MGTPHPFFFFFTPSSLIEPGCLFHVSPSQHSRDATDSAVPQRELHKFLLFLFYVFIYFLLFRATPGAYGSSQARRQMGIAAAVLHHRHSNARSKPRLRPAPQIMAMLDPQAPERGQGSNPHPHVGGFVSPKPRQEFLQIPLNIGMGASLLSIQNPGTIKN